MKSNNRKNKIEPQKVKKEKTKLKKILLFLPNFWKKNIVNKIILIGVLIAIIIIILLFAFKKKIPGFVLNEFYDVYPEEVRALYANLVDVSCTGDLHLDIKLDDKKTTIANLNKNNLLDYLFSNIDKAGGLNDDLPTSLINSKTKELFSSNVDLIKDINNYQHGDYIYSVNDNKITREKKECQSDIKYVSFLYGYSWNKNLLSMDVNISYQKGNTLYDLADKELGEYDGDVSKLFNLTKNTSYYRFNYVKSGNYYKLDSVEWLNRS